MIDYNKHRNVKLTKEESDEVLERALFEKRLTVQEKSKDYKWNRRGERQQCTECGNNLYSNGQCPRCEF